MKKKLIGVFENRIFLNESLYCILRDRCVVYDVGCMIINEETYVCNSTLRSSINDIDVEISETFLPDKYINYNANRFFIPGTGVIYAEGCLLNKPGEAWDSWIYELEVSNNIFMQIRNELEDNKALLFIETEDDDASTVMQCINDKGYVILC